MRFTAAHPPCATAVATRLPPGYPVEEGVGLYCPTCRVAWWAQPGRERPAARVPAGTGAAATLDAWSTGADAGGPGADAPEAGAPTGSTVAADAAASATGPPRRPHPAQPAPILPSAASVAPALTGPSGPRRLGPAPAAIGSTARGAEPPVASPARPPSALRRWAAPVAALAVFVVLAVVVALSAVDPGQVEPVPTVAAVSTPTAPPAVTPDATPSPGADDGPARSVTRRVAGRRVSATLPAGWTVRRSGRRLVYAGPAGARVTVGTGPRRGRDLARLGRDVARGLAPRGQATRRLTTVGARPAVAVAATGQRVLAVLDGRRRWLIRRPAGAGRAVARSVRIRPAA